MSRRIKAYIKEYIPRKEFVVKETSDDLTVDEYEEQMRAVFNNPICTNEIHRLLNTYAEVAIFSISSKQKEEGERAIGAIEALESLLRLGEKKDERVNVL